MGMESPLPLRVSKKKWNSDEKKEHEIVFEFIDLGIKFWHLRM